MDTIEQMNGANAGLPQPPPQVSPEQALQVQMEMILGVHLRGILSCYNRVPPQLLLPTLARIFGANISTVIAGPNEQSVQQIRKLLKRAFVDGVNRAEVHLQPQPPQPPMTAVPPNAGH